MDSETTLKLLNANFKTLSIEKYPEANLDFLVTEVTKKVLGKNFNKSKIGIKKQYKIHDIVLKQMRNRYGHLINIKIMSTKKWRWVCNLNRVYKTELGRLFGTYIYDDFFFTSHSLDRWEERINHERFKYFTQFFKIRYHTDPTNLDILIFNIQLTHQIGIKINEKQYRYLSMNQGCLIVEILGGICIAKTFLSIDMVKDDKDITWYGNDNTILEDVSDCIAPEDELEEDFKPVDEEISADFCAAYFKKI